MGLCTGLCMGLGTVCVDVVFVRVLYDHYLPMVARCVQVRLGFDDTRTLMKEIDSDGSGSINYREFVRFLRGSADTSEASAKAAAAASSGRPGGSASGDSGSSGKPALKLSDRVSSELRSKFDAAISSGKIRSYEDVFKAMDKDGNGTVSRREFEDGLADLRVSVSCRVWRGR